ncbi:hypothetical protein TIFTF001_030548 [Ficus carica]|uniref:C2 domain-containing protein n=1 Tax=Ficus carica TaxID=3494 RepID=A0AA88J300_FICCA|nr:hypothetical protein TIFTF001_030548 [Ficus carica]
MASLPTYYALQFHHCSSPTSPKLCFLRRRGFSRRFPAAEKVGVFTFRENLRGEDKVYSVCCLCKASSAEVDRVSTPEETERPPFDINLAVVLAGFAFEAYTSPPENVGRREVDVADCKTVYLSESFVRETYDGQVFVKLKEGVDLPAMDPWVGIMLYAGTSDPYVVMELDGQVVKSKIIWGPDGPAFVRATPSNEIVLKSIILLSVLHYTCMTKEPKWNEDFTFNIKQPPKRNLQVAAWDANLVAPHKRMGNTGINLESLCDGNMHELLVELEGMGGGGKLKLEVSFLVK